MMKRFVSIYLTFLAISISCSKNNTVPADIPPAGISKINLLKLEVALNNPNTDLVNLINKVRGSIGTNGSGSKVIWSRKNDYKLGLFISANHVYGIQTWPSGNEEFVDLSTINNGIFIGSQLPPRNGSVRLTNELIANFGLYHPTIPVASSNTTILPRDDFYLGIIDNQRIINNGLGNYPSLVRISVPLKMYDPENRTFANQSWSGAVADEIVIALGYPQDIAKYPNGAISAGKVYSDADAINIIQSLHAKGDVEGAIPYDPEAEFLANISAVAGMSGGGVFNAEGQVLGIMVRATELNGDPILRVVRTTYIRQTFNAFYNSLSLSDKGKLWPFISGELP